MFQRNPQIKMSWMVGYNPVDSIVVFTVSARFITAKAWAQDGTRGRWTAGFDNTWVVPTTYDLDAEDWYCFPFLLQDGDTQQTDMKGLSANTTLQLVGTGPVELFYDPWMETKGIHRDENVLGFDDDPTSKLTANTPGITVHGPHTMTFPPKHAWDNYCHDGHGGPLYRMFSVGTTPAAAPGGSYTVTMTARSQLENRSMLFPLAPRHELRMTRRSEWCPVRSRPTSVAPKPHRSAGIADEGKHAFATCCVEAPVADEMEDVIRAAPHGALQVTPRGMLEPLNAEEPCLLQASRRVIDPTAFTRRVQRVEILGTRQHGKDR